MKKIGSIQNYQSLKLYLLPILAWWLAGFSLLYHLGYQQSFLFLNRHFYLPLDWFMLDATFLGNGIVLIAFCILLFVHRQPENIILTIISLVISGIVIWLCKFLFFDGWNRPSMVFSGKEAIHTIGSYRLFLHSFPSGHSIAVASIFTVLVTAFESYWSILLCSFLTILISYTRIYTGVHFLGDVMTASVMGTLVAVLVLYFFCSPVHQWYKTRTIYQHYLMRSSLIVLACIIIVVSGYENIHYLII